VGGGVKKTGENRRILVGWVRQVRKKKSQKKKQQLRITKKGKKKKKEKKRRIIHWGKRRQGEQGRKYIGRRECRKKGPLGETEKGQEAELLG